MQVQCEFNTLACNTRVKYLDAEINQSLTGVGVAKLSNDKL